MARIKKKVTRVKQDSRISYQVENDANSSIKGKHAIHFPEQRMVIYVKDPSKEAEVRARYTND